jgi:hypothetical protein
VTLVWLVLFGRLDVEDTGVDELLRSIAVVPYAESPLNATNVSDASFYLTFDDYNHVRNHVYAAAWWQSVPRFLSVMAWIGQLGDNNDGKNYTALVKLEAACHLPLEFQPDDVRLTVNWLDFGVEHLSKWWKLTRYQKHQTAYQTLGQRLGDYIRRIVSMNEQVSSFSSKNEVSKVHNPWQDTLALVAYSPLVGPRAPQRAQRLDAAVTAATLASLVQKGCRRIVLVLDKNDFIYVSQNIWPAVVTWLKSNQSSSIHRIEHNDSWEAYWDAREENASDQTRFPPTVRVHKTDLVLHTVDAHIPDDQGRRQKRVPRQTLVALYHALQSSPPPQSQPTWLGTMPFKYIYYTEQDSLLHTSLLPQSLSMFQSSLDRDELLIPHRWQPMPHASDFQWDESSDLPPSFYVPSIPPWDRVYLLDDPRPSSSSSLSYCCDGGLSSTLDVAAHSPCQDYWYLCGLGRHAGDGGNDMGLVHLRSFTYVWSFLLSLGALLVIVEFPYYLRSSLGICF